MKQLKGDVLLDDICSYIYDQIELLQTAKVEQYILRQDLDTLWDKGQSGELGNCNHERVTLNEATHEHCRQLA